MNQESRNKKSRTKRQERKKQGILWKNVACGREKIGSMIYFFKDNKFLLNLSKKNTDMNLA